jgi:hypothetical protein
MVMDELPEGLDLADCYSWANDVDRPYIKRINLICSKCLHYELQKIYPYGDGDFFFRCDYCGHCEEPRDCDLDDY